MTSSPRPSPLDRRTFLAAVGAAAGGVLLPTAAARAAGPGGGPTGQRAVTAAMHVHGSWSEGTGSWEAQFDQASSLGVDVLNMTDHDHRALAHKYLPHLRGARFETLRSGSAVTRVATDDAGSFRLEVESDGGQPATSGLQVERKPMALNRLRTSIAGTTLQHAFGAVRLPVGATYEVVVALSRHPARGGRPAGELELRYRFGDGLTRGWSLERDGLVGVVRAPAPAPGTLVPLVLVEDVAALWPDLLAPDNALLDLSFVVTSPRRGVPAEVGVRDVTIQRREADPDAFRRHQRQIIETYGRRWPDVTARADIEVSNSDPHLNVFGVPQVVPAPADTEQDDVRRAYPRLVAQVQRDGGLVSYNHPLGDSGGPLLSQAAQNAKRRQVFREMWDVDAFGTDVLEVAYQVRGACDIDTHLALWDTFSRRGRFFTGNGVSDDHDGARWASLGNGFATGLWSGSTGEAAVLRALRGGRAYAKLLGGWRDGEIDLLVDGTVPMGAVDVSSAASRRLAVYVGNPPRGGRVDVVQGVVDLRGDDPLTVVLDRLPSAAFGGDDSTVARTVDTTTSSFLRVVVRDSRGKVVGVGNPVWLLREVPPGGIPAASRV